MLSKTNIENRLIAVRNKRISSEDILFEVTGILNTLRAERSNLERRISEKQQTDETRFKLELLERERIFHSNDIKALCINYRLRFLDAHFFKGDVPAEAISKMRQLEQDHQTKLEGLKIIAPAKLLKLENADDPLLLASIGNDYYYLIHKWGNDLSPFRKWTMWPYKSFENLVFTIFLVSILLTAMTPMQLFTKGDVTPQEYVLMLLFMFKAVAGIVLFYGFAKGKNFNSAIWNSKYYNG